MQTILNVILKLIRDQKALELKINRSKVTSLDLDVMGV